jgi:hypothetical protein
MHRRVQDEITKLLQQVPRRTHSAHVSVTQISIYTAPLLLLFLLMQFGEAPVTYAKIQRLPTQNSYSPCFRYTDIYLYRSTAIIILIYAVW